MLSHEKIEVPKLELDNILSDLQSFISNRPDLSENDDKYFWYNWLDSKKREIEQFRKNHILGQKENETWAIVEINYFNATQYERGFGGTERLCGEFELFLSEEKAVEAFNNFRLQNVHEKRFREGARWFSFRSLGITHFEVKKISEYQVKEFKGEDIYAF